MPKSCSECPLMEYNEEIGCYCYLTNQYASRTRPDGCPLIELPPHGRLIDADALENEAQMRLLECNKYDNQFQKPYEVMRAIALAPTIIPAEESEYDAE